MGFQFVVKAKQWTPGKAKKLKVPAVQISAGYDDTTLIKLPGDKRATFEATLAKLWEPKEKDTLIMAGARMRGVLSAADAVVEKEGDDKHAEDAARKAQSELGEVCRDIERVLIPACVACVQQAYKTTMQGAALVGRVDCKAEAKVTGKIVVDGAAGGGEEDSGAAAEEFVKVLSGLVYPAQDDAEGVVADSKVAKPLIDKTMKDANVLSKAMREQAKKETPAGEKLITTTAAGMQKNLQIVTRMVEGSQSKLRQVKAKLVAAGQKTREAKNGKVDAAVRACMGSVEEIGDLFTGYGTIKPMVDGLSKEFDGKTVPDFGKMLTVLNRLANPKPSAELEGNLSKLGDAIAEAANG